ncbi:MAG: helix-turn-helix transcriptional regulator, partial [Pedobacter sp.]|nr:helix-turn-helix transcriptional regulator [Pedobacter sp.]
MSPSLRNIAFLSESDADQELFHSLMAVMGDRTGCRWACSPDLAADVVVIDTDNRTFFERFRKHVHTVVVGFGDYPAPGTHYHLPKPLRMRPLGDLLTGIVRDGLGERDEIILRYMAEMTHPHVAMDVVMEMVQRMPSGIIDKETVARHMGISPSTLQRRLAAEGASFRQLLNDTRRDLAERYLLESGRPIKEVAYSLGFADLSNFTRAFRSWFGQSPRE